jgi:cathepsin L
MGRTLVRFRLLLSGALFAGGAAATAQEPNQPFNVEKVLAHQQEMLPGEAKFKIGDSKAYRLVMQTKAAILAADAANVPHLALDHELEHRAFRQAVHTIAATRFPKNFLALEQLRAKKPEQLLSLSPGINPNAPAFDWRSQGKVPPVRTYLNNTGQDGCGDCWCFAAICAFESNHLLRYGGQPDSIDASEQEILNCGHTGGCDGDWYQTAWIFMQQTGTATEDAVPYHAVVQPCSATVDKPFKVDDYGLVDDQHYIPTVQQIKQALCAHGPLAVAVEADEWFVAYKSGTFVGFPSDANTNSNPRINHAVTLIGWDDEKSAWLIRNNWGSDWGNDASSGKEGGYMWIDYNSNNIGFAAAWCSALP